MQTSSHPVPQNQPARIPFTFDGIPGQIQVSQAGAFVSWSTASFWSTAIKGPLREAVDAAIAARG